MLRLLRQHIFHGETGFERSFVQTIYACELFTYYDDLRLFYLFYKLCYLSFIYFIVLRRVIDLELRVHNSCINHNNIKLHDRSKCMNNKMKCENRYSFEQKTYVWILNRKNLL